MNETQKYFIRISTIIVIVYVIYSLMIIFSQSIGIALLSLTMFMIISLVSEYFFGKISLITSRTLNFSKKILDEKVDIVKRNGKKSKRKRR